MATGKLKNLIKLNSKVTVIVPATMDVNKEIDNTPYVEKVAETMSKYFGGATSTQSIGYWMSESCGLVKENSTTVYSYAKEADIIEHIDDIVTMCEELKEEMKQESIAMELNGEMYFI